MPVTRKKNKRPAKTYWDKDESAYLKAWLMILISECQNAIVQSEACQDHAESDWKFKQVQHWNGIISGLKHAYNRVDSGIDQRLFEEATRIALGL